MVSLEWYRSFIAVYRASTVSAAAKTLFLTQPAVSQHLASLESAFGKNLFTRTPRKMIPTDAGKELYARVVQSIERLESISEDVRLPATSRRASIRLGAPSEFFRARMISRLESPAFDLKVQFGMTKDLLARLKDATLDVVLATQKLDMPELTYTYLDTEEFILVAGTQGKIKKLISPTPKAAKDLSRFETWLSQLPWIAYGTELPIIRRFWQENFRQRPTVNPTLVIPDLVAVLKAVEQGYGVSLVPDYLCESSLRSRRIKVLWKPTYPTKNDLYFVYRKSDRFEPTIKECTKWIGGLIEQKS